MGVRQLHELPGVGKNLHNHVAFYMSYKLKKRKSTNQLNWVSVLRYLLHREGPMSSTGLSQVTARINSKYAEPTGSNPDLQIFFAGFLAHCSSSPAAAEEETDETITVSPVTLHPKSRGYVTLKSNDPLDSPLIHANYLHETDDINVLIDGIRVIQRLANTATLKNKHGMELARETYGECGERYSYDSEQFWECAIRKFTGPENHQVGSCKMGPFTDPLAVVSPKLEVHGVAGLRVVDASVMPSVVSGNTHATVVMIAEKGVDYIKQKWLGTPLLGGSRSALGADPGHQAIPGPKIASRTFHDALSTPHHFAYLNDYSPPYNPTYKSFYFKRK